MNHQPIHARSRRGIKRGAAVGTALAVAAGVVATNTGPSPITASSHREAPLIAGDPRADNTDLYAFVSPDDPDSVTLISNWLPFEEPNGGPNFYPWAEDALYHIKIDNDGDALADITYTWEFTTVINDPSTFLYNTGPVTSIDDPDLNYYQTYDLTVTDSMGTTTLLDDQRAAPSLVGPGSIPDYAPLMEGATVDLPGGGQTYAGQADDPFFLDLRVFDLLYGGDLSEVGEDTLAGYNVNAVAIQVPKTALAINGDADANPVIGIWSTTDRRTERAADGSPTGAVDYTQVSRLGNPLVNEVVFPLALKDAFNSISPDIDATIPAAVDAVSNPLLPPLIEAIYGVPAPETPRNDLEEIFLQGVSEDNSGLGGDPAEVLNVNLNGHNLNADAGAIMPSEQLRLNMAVPTSAEVNRLSLFAGQFDGFPNGRRLEDDVVDIAVQTVMGAAQSGTIVEALAAGDAVDRNDRDFQASFPYLALPHGDSVNLGPERPPVSPGDFISQTPERVLDTRPGAGQIGYVGEKPADGAVVEVQVVAQGGADTLLDPDADAKAILANAAAFQSTERGFVTVYNCDDERPTAANLNYGPGEVANNLVVVGVSDSGTVCMYTDKSANLSLDIVGTAPSESAIEPVTPQRVLETRVSDGQIGYTGDSPAADSVVKVDLSGVADVPADAHAVFLNVTAIRPANTGFVTAFNCDDDRPTAASLNFAEGDIIPNLVLAGLSADQEVCLYTDSALDLTADLSAVLAADASLTVSTPERILETRESVGQIGYSGDRPAANDVIEVQVTGVGDTNVPADTTAAWISVTSVNEADSGFFTVFPCGENAPTAASGNYRGKNTASLAAAKIGDGGKVCIFVSAPADFVVDLVGHVPA